MSNKNPEQAVLRVSEIVQRYGLQLPEKFSGFCAGKPEKLTKKQPTSIAVLCPSTEEPLYQLIESDDDAVDRAVAAARQTFDKTDWATMPHAQRRIILSQVCDAIAEHSEELAVIQALEVGLPLSSVQYMHMPRTIENFKFAAELAGTLSGESYNQTGQYLSIVSKEPVGVAALITPWNAPLVLLSSKMAVALALGNTCVIKASEYAPYSVFRFIEILHQAGLPEGVVNLVNGRGESTGKCLIEHPDVDVISFIGGTTTGARIMSSAATGIKKVGLELGGKSANIVFDSADIDKAIDGSLLGILAGNGEQCLAGSRIFVQRSIAEQFTQQFAQRMANVRVGDPFDPNTEVGPMAFAQHRDKVLSYAQIATDEGAELLTGGNAHPAFKAGYFVQPTVVKTSNNRARVCQEEIFGPFATIATFDTVDEALKLANDSDFGLVSYVWSEHLPTVMRASREIKAGTVWVNTSLTRDLRASFGGYKKSGIGRDGVRGSVDLFTEDKTTMIPTGELSLPKLGL